MKPAIARSPLAYRPSAGRMRLLQRAGAPFALSLLGALAVVAFAFSDPVVLVGAGAGVIALGLLSGATRALRFAAAYGIALGLFMIAVNALVSQRGETVLVRGPDLPLLGTIDVTLESLGEGATIALRVVVVVAAFAVATACVDPNEVLRMLRPLARRSAMTATLIGRLAPVAAEDGFRLAEAARLRGPAAAPVGRAALARRLVAGSLERSLDVAATLELRGYSLPAGSVRRVRSRPSGYPVLSASHLTYSYPGCQRPALVDVDLQVKPGEFVLLTGRSGSGKSSLLQAACGLVPHFHGGEIAGRIVIGGMDVREHGPGEIAAVAGYLAQDPEAQVVSTTVRAELSLPLELRGEPASARGAAVAGAAAAMGVTHLIDRTADTLSGGELQRVALAAALAGGPPLVLLDEPISQLDREGADELVALLRALRRDWNSAIVLAEHRVEGFLGVADRVVELDQGRIAFEGSPSTYTESRELSALAISRRTARLEAPEVTRGASAELALELHEAGVELDAGKGSRKVLHDVDLIVRPGERVAVLGPNGAGKSTLLRAFAGIVPLSAGSISAPRGCALLTQTPADFLVRERVVEELPGAAGLKALRMAGLEWAMDRDPHDLSGGERQRLALAIVLAGRENGGLPGAVCLDEPTRGMDPARKRDLAMRLSAMAEDGAAVLVATHDEAFARSFCERVIEIRDGRVIAGAGSGQPAEELSA